MYQVEMLFLIIVKYVITTLIMIVSRIVLEFGEGMPR